MNSYYLKVFGGKRFESFQELKAAEFERPEWIHFVYEYCSFCDGQIAAFCYLPAMEMVTAIQWEADDCLCGSHPRI